MGKLDKYYNREWGA